MTHIKLRHIVASGQAIAQTGPDGTRWAIERDALGQPVSIEGPDDQTWQITRNERGHPLAVTGPEGTTAFAYENEQLPDRPTTMTDAGGATHQREWNALGQVTAQIDCSQQRTEYAYDRNGYLASVTNALGETTRTQHDEMGRRVATQLPDGLYWHHHMDALGRLVELEGPQGFRQQVFFDDHGRPAYLWSVCREGCRCWPPASPWRPKCCGNSTNPGDTAIVANDAADGLGLI
ncbi:RHS repeat domain-containing protein [Halomonas faecis]|uniref:RHS repeat domain-containing protein n=1 Tax=Halomonas faecis TaxID=1562110 RepID=UPI0013D7A790|nr:RHS repeat domain-containing protein [Halomonas faecis]